MASKLIPKDKSKVDTPLTKRVPMSSITCLPKILGWCSHREADEGRQIEGKFIDMHQEEKEQLPHSLQQEKQLLIQECERQKLLERLECQQMLQENQQRFKELANQQIAQLHVQFMNAHKEVTGKNESLGVKVTSSLNDLSRI